MYLADLEVALDRFGPRLAQIYGQGETPMTITALSKADHADRDHPRWQERLQSVGVARTDVEVRVVDDDGRELGAGETGEIVVRGDVVMAGYWNQPEATAEALRDGWLHTGDVGSFDEDGYLTLRDRSKDLIISGGMNIYPREVEEALLHHTGVREVAVVGRPDPEWGETVVAFVVPADGGPAADRRARPHVPGSHRPLQAAQGLPLRRRPADQQLRQGGQARAPRAGALIASAPSARRRRSVHMKLALYLPNFRDKVTVKELEDLTALAEELDFDSVWTLDRIVVPEASDRGELQYSFGMMDEFPTQLPVSSRGEWFQGWPLIPWLAAKTQKVRIGMSITDTPYRAPGVLAAELATVDHLCDGRLNVGVGAGWMPEEFAAASASHIFPKRHKHVRETIEIMQGIWTNDLFEYHGEFADFDRCGFGAKPLQKPRCRSGSAGSRTRSAPPSGSRSTTCRAGSASRTRPTRCRSGGARSGTSSRSWGARSTTSSSPA